MKPSPRPAALGIAALLLAWHLLAHLLRLPILPAPLRVAAHLWGLLPGPLAPHLAHSLARILAGLLLALAAGLPLGLLMGRSRAADSLLSPVVYIAYTVPKIALLPLLMLLLGLGDTSKIALLFLILVFQVTVAVRDAIRAIPDEATHPLTSLGAPLPLLLREILLPAALPKLITAIRVALATAISVLFLTETFGTQHGMGYFIMDAWLRVNYLDMYAGILALSGLGLLLFTLLDLAARLLCPWQDP